MKLKFVLVMFLGIVLIVCNKDNDNCIDEEKIFDYFEENSFIVDWYEFGLYY